MILYRRREVDKISVNGSIGTGPEISLGAPGREGARERPGGEARGIRLGES